MEELLEADPLLEVKKIRDPVFRKDRHLSSALVTTEITYLLKNRHNPRALKREHRDLIEKLDDVNPIILSSDGFYSWAFSVWRDFGYSGDPLTPLTTALKVADEALRISLQDYMGTAARMQISTSEDLVDTYKVKTEFDRVLGQITYSTVFHQEYKVGKWKGDAYGNLHLIWCTDRTCYLITHSHLVGLRDAVNSWFDVTLYSILNNEKYPGFLLTKEVQGALEAGRRLVTAYKSTAYTLIKLWPSLVIASILRDTEAKRDFYDTLTKDIAEFSHTPFYILATRTLCTDQAVHLALELVGLWKCFGHPDINMDWSVATWIEKGSVRKENLEGAANLLVWAFRLEFCRQHYKVHRKWPIVHIGVSAPEKIRNSIHNNTWEERTASSWIPEDFEHITLSKNLDFNFHVDVADLLSDKSIIPERAQWIHEYDKQAHRTNHGFFPTGPPPSSKSVIVHYLSQESVTVAEVLNEIEAGNVPLEWRVMVAVPKEKEFKSENARFYGKMTFPMRLYQTVTEKNMADHVFRYIRHQSMTMNEEQLTRTINKNEYTHHTLGR